MLLHSLQCFTVCAQQSSTTVIVTAVLVFPLQMNTYLLIGLWDETGHVAVPVQKILKLLLSNDELLCLSQGFLPSVLAVDQEALEHLDTGSVSTKMGSWTHRPYLLLHPSPSSGQG